MLDMLAGGRRKRGLFLHAIALARKADARQLHSLYT